MTDDTVRELEVTATTFHLNQREGKKPSMRVDYECGLRTFSEWVCFQHEGLPRRKAEAWAMARGHRPPRTVADALAIAWPHARAITVNDVGRYPEILRVVLLTEAEQDARFLADLDRMTVPASEENAHGSLA
jgi:hypothetical protein